jgi:leucine-rich PPR motif-containing protein
LFDDMKRHGIRGNGFVYGQLVNLHLKNNRVQQALEYFREMRDAAILPSHSIFIGLINALAGAGQEALLHEVVADYRKAGYKPHGRVYGGMLKLARKNPLRSHQIYADMLNENVTPVVSNFVHLLSSADSDVKLLEFYWHEMKQRGLKPDVYCFTTAISGCGMGLSCCSSGEIHRFIA